MKRKLKLNRETVRLLEASQLNDAQGGAAGSAQCTFYVSCGSCHVSCNGSCTPSCLTVC
jgi:hypothetical protein